MTPRFSEIGPISKTAPQAPFAQRPAERQIGQAGDERSRVGQPSLLAFLVRLWHRAIYVSRPPADVVNLEERRRLLQAAAIGRENR